jgi:hypothetical protein
MSQSAMPLSDAENHQLDSGDCDSLNSADPKVPEAMIAPEAATTPAPSGPKSWPVRCWHGVWWMLGVVFGWLSLMVGLAVLATIPLVNFVSLGYLLECGGKIARTGRFQAGFFELEHWGRLGSIFLGSWLLLLIPRGMAELAGDAWLINQGGVVANIWRSAQIVVTAMVFAHILLAWYCGGKLRDFFWPVLAPFSLAQWLITTKILAPWVRPLLARVWQNLADDLFTPQPLATWFPPAIAWSALRRSWSTLYVEARDAMWEFVARLELPYLWWLGVRGFIGAALWLAIPVTLLALGTKAPRDGAAALFITLGVVSLLLVLLYLPFLQVRFAAENRFRALFEVGTIRRLFQHAPLAFWLALLFTLALAIPPYAFKIEKLFPEFDWAFSLVFVTLVYPSKLLAGWAVGRAAHRTERAGFTWRWVARCAAVPVCLAYIAVVYGSQFTSWHGSRSLFEQHPFMIPVPFLDR